MSEGAVTLTTKFVLVFTAVLLIILGAVGEVTDRWAGATTPPAERAEHRASRSDSGRPREADHDLTRHDRPNLVLLPSVDDLCSGEQAVLPGQVDALGTGTRDELRHPVLHRRRVSRDQPSLAHRHQCRSTPTQTALTISDDSPV